MYVTEIKTKTKTGKISHLCTLLRESYREEGKVKNRYILRHNPSCAEEIERTRNDKKESVERLVQKKNLYLAEHRRARTNTAVKEINNKIERLKLSGWLKVEMNERSLQLKVDDNALYKESKLDGCYVITSDLPKEIDKVNRIPIPRKKQAQLFKAANVQLPHILPNLGIIVVSRKKLKKKT